jgi:regulator of PEP synthase PpsR (kinase-PPPase family)
MYDRHRLPTVDTSAASVEEIAAVVLQTLTRRRRS